jgi:hypothetical protein
VGRSRRVRKISLAPGFKAPPPPPFSP